MSKQVMQGLNGTHSDEEPVYREAKNYGLEVHDPWEVVYTEVKKSGVVEKEVILECGPSLPDVYIWGFTKPGTETLRAVVYNFGRGPKIQRLTRSLGELSVNDSSASISIAKLPLAAQGLYTCQALYDTAQGARLYYYYIYLRVLVPVTRPSVVSSDSSPAEGSSTRMRCGLENGTEPIDYIWEQENKEGAISVLAQSNNSVLDLAYVTRNHTGWYRCLARNEVNKVLSERFWLDVFFGPDLPRIDIRPYSVTEQGYSVLERETVSLTCQASSHPLSQYVWLYNSSQVNSGPMLSLPSISRGQTGLYTCLSENKYINTSSEKTVSLSVYYPPDGSPSCTVRPTNNYTDLTLWCSWEGGYPHASLHWSPFLPGANGQGYANATLTQRGPGTANNSVFECHGSHVALNGSTSCSTRTWHPPGEPQCYANATLDSEHLVLSCSWEGGFPRALIWWSSSNGDTRGTYEESSNTLVLPSNVTHDSKPFTCLAQHPLFAVRRECVLKLDPPGGIPSCTIIPTNNYTDLTLWCSWEGGYPHASLHWSPFLPGANGQGYANATLTQRGPGTANNSVFECHGSHVALKTSRSCSTRTWHPQGDPQCYANATLNNEHLILSCWWEGGFPTALLWWSSGAGEQLGASAESTNTLVLPSSVTYSSRSLTCHAQHPLFSERKDCALKIDPPDGSPSCTVRPTNNYTDLTLWCSWEGGYPHTSLHWSPFLPGANGQGYANATLTQRGPGTANNSVFECHGSHVALKTSRSCRISTWYPPGEAQCSAMATQNNEKLVLTCSWEGGLPRALLWWLSSSGDTLGKSEESSNTLVLPPSAALSGQSFVCHAKHPLLAQRKSCVLKLDAPVLETQRSTVSVYEGGDVEITCTARDNYFPSNITWYNHLKQHVIESPSKYVLKHARGWTNLTVKATDSQTDSGQYWCSATNAVGETEIPIHLLVNRHPVPPNVTISKIIFSGHGRTEANLNWDTTAQGEITEFIIERRQLPLSSGKTKTEPPWQEVASKLAPGTRSYEMRGLDPTRLYAVRIRAVNHLTLGNPSEEKVPEAVPVTKPSIVLSHSSPAEGSSIWMRCDLENGTEPFSYLWEQESKEGTTSILAQGTNNNLVNVTMVTRNHAGWHRCIVGNEVSQEQSKRISLNVVFGPDVPHIEVTPRSVTEQGYSALEKETVSLVCQASSNPPSQYVWFYNNSQVHAGQMLTVRNIPRTSSGHYTCLAQNTNLNTRSKKSITLTVYYPPDGTPLCTILPTNNYTDLTLWCSWEGGSPHALLRWSPFLQGMSRQGYANVSFIQRGPATANNSVFVCHGSHVALNVSTSCSTRTWHPPGEPQCYAYATRNNEYLMFSCSWEGGFPRALLWWASSMGEAQGKSEENSNILVLHSSATYSGKSFVCHAQHPLFSERKQCVLKLEAPVLVTQRSMVSVYEGSDVQLTCILKANYPATEITWYNNLKQHVIETPSKYVLQRAAAWSNLTVRETDGLRDSGQYWCSATNAVGGTEIPIHLLVKRYPMPPNVTISKLVYSSRQRTEVDMEWFLKTQGDITGFIIERRRLPQSAGKRDADPPWQEVAVNLDPSTQTYKMSGFDPTGLYAVRLMAVNHRTIGHPSDAKSPADPRFTAYSAVIGAGLGGMIIAVVVIVLLFIYIMRNRNNNPRLHELLFGIRNSLSRENINFPEDEISGRAEDINREHIPGPVMEAARPTLQGLSST
ncbi:hemicentin-2-like [Alosa alosa]|uniref:hemicentin-2-like n=1 Tax=Alosa alosa TaxID=278164 RepID=UPI00201510CD|nr:hemicentin-2-like [Alosa alosa]